jgi:hypothetical protein
VPPQVDANKPIAAHRALPELGKEQPVAANRLYAPSGCRLHGHQQLSLFNAHYDERCFLPIHVYQT